MNVLSQVKVSGQFRSDSKGASKLAKVMRDFGELPALELTCANCGHPVFRHLAGSRWGFTHNFG